MVALLGLTSFETTAKAHTENFFRLYNSNTGEHRYTYSRWNRDDLIDIGWRAEGVGWVSNSNDGYTNIFTLKNPATDEEFYTIDKIEYDYLSLIGWEALGPAALMTSADQNIGVPIYRLYNPYEKTFNHHYTASIDERDWLVSLGWIYEGIAFYGSVSENESVFEYVIEDIGEITIKGLLTPSTITDLVIPDQITDKGSAYPVTKIDLAAFDGDTQLQTLTISDSIQSIGRSAFENTKSLQKVTLGSGIKTIEFAAFSGSAITEITIPDNITRIESFAFNDSSLEQVTLGVGLEMIGTYAFSSTNLTEITIPGNIKNIGSGAFFEAESLQMVTLDIEIEIINQDAFSSTGITEITIPNSVASIGGNAFYDTPLVSISLPDKFQPTYENFLPETLASENIHFTS
ncbi:leucine-rich repeat protein [Enterococcus sp. HY326]|uniref:leucine-rich repeat protein n=1 Tax=Enterococcus sp. HY326 TaxID=2971265 RepID=UPI00223F0F1B|nr:leucine-rich repeat protein [Enterococcus sp. HY326]